jgi:hypothetical protein
LKRREGIARNEAAAASRQFVLRGCFRQGFLFCLMRFPHA